MVTLRIFIATIFRRYTFVLEEDSTKPVGPHSLANPSRQLSIFFACGSPLVRGFSVDQSRVESV